MARGCMAIRGGTADLEHNRFGDPVLVADAARSGFERRVMKGETVVLTDAMRRVVRDTIVEDCRHRGVRLIALNVRASHVHVVVSAAMDPGKLARHF